MYLEIYEWCTFLGFWLTLCAKVTPYVDIDLGKLWLSKWLNAWRYQALVWINVDLSSKVFCNFHIKRISSELLMNRIPNLCSETTLSKLLPHITGASECIYPWPAHVNIEFMSPFHIKVRRLTTIGQRYSLGEFRHWLISICVIKSIRCHLCIVGNLWREVTARVVRTSVIGDAGCF